VTVPYATKAPHPDWKVGIGPDPVSLFAEVLNCQQVWRWLTRAQRDALVVHTAGDRISAHPRVLASLHKRGLVGVDDELTEAGRLVRKWNLPIVERVP
jgi:hypothetical protein